MQYCLTSDTKDCRNCYKCIRHCPIKAISFRENKAEIIKEDCILCGECYNICPQDLKVIRNDTEKVRRLIRYNDKVIVSLAPSFISRYPDTDIRCMRNTLKKLGFFDVEETAVGATIVKKAYDEMLEEGRDVIISSCCHSINLLIQRHYPECLPYLADILSPMLAHGKDIKLRYGEDTKVVFIGPCIAKKDESDKNHQIVEAALTFRELDKWLAAEGIAMETTGEKELTEKSRARLFPTNGGILKTMECKNSDFDYLVCDGVRNAMKTLKDIREGKLHHCFIEMSSCQGSCVNGPLMAERQLSIMSATIPVNRFAGPEDFEGFRAGRTDIGQIYAPESGACPEPSAEAIQDMLKQMGKEDPASRLNCGCCGYGSCEKKAAAIIKGNARIEMCLPHLMEQSESLSNKIVENFPGGLMILDTDLNIRLINKPMCRILGSVSAADAVGTQVTAYLDPFDYLDALQGDKIYMKKEYLGEYGRYVENTIVLEEKSNLLVCVMQDVTQEEEEAKRRQELIEKTLKITDSVIEHNMKTVHEIASLLGETAAETKTALLSLKDAVDQDEV